MSNEELRKVQETPEYRLGDWDLEGSIELLDESVKGKSAEHLRGEKPIKLWVEEATSLGERDEPHRD